MTARTVNRMVRPRSSFRPCNDSIGTVDGRSTRTSTAPFAFTPILDAAGLRATVDPFFDRVLVNDPDEALRNNRLALLSQLRTLFGGIGDLSRLPG